MCGRFTHFHSWAEIREMYRLIREADIGRNTAPRYNITPTQDVPFVHLDQDGNQIAEDGRWWLVPFWAKELPKHPMFNARSEDAETKPSFRDAYKSKRCLVPADGFYEWTKANDGGKVPWFIYLPDCKPFSFAGLWARNDTLGITSCTILTAAAEGPMEQLHTRQPVILDQAVYDEWLSPETLVPEAKALLSRNLDGELRFHRVSREVNSSKFVDDERTIEPV